MSRRWRRRLGLGLLGLGGLALLGVASAVGLLMTGLPATTGAAVMPGLEKPVTVARDALGVPTIFAASEADAHRALGYVHAQDRLIQMEFTRRFAAGRLAEVAGPAALESDRLLRALGIERLAEASLATLPPPVIAALEAYAAGVNAYLQGHSGAWPPEYYLLGLSIEPWRPADSLLWARLMALRLGGNWRAEAARLRARQALPPERFDFLFHPDATAADATPWPAGAITAAEAALATLPDAIAPTLASNAWAIAGARTASGKPLLASDPHLGFSAPAIWYLARIETPGRHLAGATAPGAPFVILGQNDDIAWGLTTTGAAVDDLVVERLTPGDPTRVDGPDGPEPIAARTETIKVRGAADVSLTVRATRHGPIVSDIDPALAGVAGVGYVAALQATALLPDDRSSEAIWRLNRAKGWGDFRAALAAMGAPTQNFVYADRAGTIGLVVGGRIPIRRGGDGGLLPRQGWTGIGEWTGFIAPEDMPAEKDPARGFVANGNDRVTAPGDTRPITPIWEPPYRGDRLRALLAGAGGRDVASEAATQRDSLEPPARPLIALLGPPAATDPPRRAAAKALLAGWDGAMDAEAAAPLLYAAWETALRRGFRAGLKPPSDAAEIPLDRVIAALGSGAPGWCDPDCPALMARALDEALDAVEAAHGADWSKWRWGEAHRVTFANPILGRIPMIKALVNPSLGVPGGNDTLRRAAYRARLEDGVFEDVHGPAYRAVYDLGDPARSRFTIAPGQSGHPLSRHYGDWIDVWAKGEGLALTGSLEALRAAGAEILTLEPPAR